MKILKFLFTFFLLGILGYFLFIRKENCLFYENGKCYTCQKNDVFWVGLPENCVFCPNHVPQYSELNNLSIWACLPETEKELFDTLILPSQKSPCPKEVPLQDILGHCYPCTTEQPVQIDESQKNTCLGKRYLTEFRLSEKSHKCPPKRTITNPEICISCQGFWNNEKCFSEKKEMAFCSSNQECQNHEFCSPFRYSYQGKTGICRNKTKKNWICSDTDGYNEESAQLFCKRQGAHLPSLSSLYSEKEDIFKACPNKNIWIFFEEGTLFLKSIEDEFPITNERIAPYVGGDNFYALCQKD